MEATHVSPSPITTPHTHPLLLVAAASVTVLSLAGVGVLAGWLPGPGAHSAEPAKSPRPPPRPRSRSSRPSACRRKRPSPPQRRYRTPRDEYRAPRGAGASRRHRRSVADL
jgi:hypothetical protein